jgi:hypothetical protein
LCALVGALAPMLLLAGCAARPVYLRVIVSDKCVVYLEYDNHSQELRAAASPGELKTNPSVKIRLEEPSEKDQPRGIRTESKEFLLPIPADQLPSGVTAVKAAVGVIEYGLEVWGRPELFFRCKFIICRKDEKNAEWQYETKRNVPTDVAVRYAPAIGLQWFEKVALAFDVWRFPGTEIIHIYGEWPTDLRKDGKSVMAQVSILDASGKELTSQNVAFNDLADRGCSVHLAKGVYTCVVTLDVGPIGGMLKAEEKVVVP